MTGGLWGGFRKWVGFIEVSPEFLLGVDADPWPLLADGAAPRDVIDRHTIILDRVCVPTDRSPDHAGMILLRLHGHALRPRGGT